MGKNLLRDQKSCVIINGSTTTKYFSLEGGAYQGDLFSAFLFGSALEVLFILIKSKPEIEGMTIFAYGAHTTFSLKDIISIKHIVDAFCTFPD